MTTIQFWLALFIAGVVTFMVGTLIPSRIVIVIGAIAATVGGLGWFIQSLN